MDAIRAGLSTTSFWCCGCVPVEIGAPEPKPTKTKQFKPDGTFYAPNEKVEKQPAVEAQKGGRLARGPKKG